MSKRYARQDSTRHIRLGSRRSKKTWRRPVGTHSKMRRQRKSYPASPKIGCRTPKSERKTFSKSLIINSIKDLDKIEKNSSCILSSKIGARKRLEIIKLANEKDIKLVNVKNLETKK